MDGRLIGCVAGLVMLGAGVAAVAAPGSATSPSRLQPFGSCGELLSYAKAHGGQIAGAGGLTTPSGVVAAPPAAVGARSGGGDVFSETNVQEAGVDEPDLVKSDGSHIFALAGDKLYAVDARAAKPRLLDSVALPQGSTSQLLLYKGRLLVLTRSGFLPRPLPARAGIMPYLPTETLLTEVDVHDPAAMQVVRTLSVDGLYLTARRVGATARVVIAASPRIPPIGIVPTPNRRAIDSSPLRTWLPSAVLTDRRTGKTTTRSAVQCRAVRRPARFSGVGVVTILTVDLTRGLPAVDSDAVMMGSGTVYASADALYLASQSWFAIPLAGTVRPEPSGMTTEIDKFDTSQPGTTTYEASGSVSGFLLSQWSLSEYKGNLRVASTDVPSWWNPSPQRASETSVHVLAQRDRKLVEIGRVGGLGHGENVYAVRFAGATGFVVTFRQVDPLYTLDLSDPTDPSLLGTLELRGYSSYLHPVGNDRMLGVGQDATDQGRVLGTQLSLFDISDLRKPDRLDAAVLGPGSSEVEYDPHAFLYWAAKGLAVVPVQIAAGPFTGAIAFRVGRTAVKQIARLTNPSDTPIRRSLVIGDRLYTLSDGGVQAVSLDTFADVGWVPFS
jgi:uncharacterized secreted protein with C-terminal beta-propeller domain